VLLDDYRYGVLLHFTSPRNVAEARRYVWPNGYRPPDAVLLPQASATESILRPHRQGYQGHPTLSDREPRHHSFALNLTSLGLREREVWNHMRPSALSISTLLIGSIVVFRQQDFLSRCQIQGWSHEESVYCSIDG
jgi:hypothetical protein